MRSRKRPFFAYFLLFLSILFVCLGQWGLAGQKDLLEYAAPYHAPQADPEGNREELPLVELLRSLRDQLPEASLAASIVKRDGQAQSTAGREADCSIQGITEGWFDLYHRALLTGRLFGQEELNSTKRVAVVDAGLAFTLWGSGEAVGHTLVLFNEEFQVIGVVRQQSNLPMPTNGQGVYIPLPAAVRAGMEADMQLISVSGASLSFFEGYVKSALPSGRVYNLQKERMRAGLALRYLFVFLLLILLPKALSRANVFSRRCLNKWKEKYSHLYPGQMILPTLLMIGQWLMVYGVCLALVYLALRVAIAPAYVLTEWMPEDPSRLSSYGNMLRHALDQRTALIFTIPQSVHYIRYCGFFIKAGAFLSLIAMALPKRSQARP